MTDNRPVASKLKAQYSKTNLLHELPKIALRSDLSKDEFVEIQLKQFQQLNPKTVLADGMTVDSASHSSEWRPTGQFVGGETRLMVGLRSAYENNVENDIFSNVVFENLGNVVTLTDLNPYATWRKSKIFENVLNSFGIKDVTAVAFPRPFHSHEVIVMYFFRKQQRPLLDFITRDQIIAYALPFYFCWLYKYGWIDEKNMRRGLQSIVGHTPTQLRALRVMCRPDHIDRKSLGEAYGSKNNEYKTAFSSLTTMIRRIVELDIDHDQDRHQPGYYEMVCRYRYELLGCSGTSSHKALREMQAKKY